MADDQNKTPDAEVCMPKEGLPLPAVGAYTTPEQEKDMAQELAEARKRVSGAEANAGRIDAAVRTITESAENKDKPDVPAPMTTPVGNAGQLHLNQLVDGCEGATTDVPRGTLYQRFEAVQGGLIAPQETDRRGQQVHEALQRHSEATDTLSSQFDKYCKLPEGAALDPKRQHAQEKTKHQI